MTDFTTYFPERERCYFCGHADANHRLKEMIWLRHRGGESVPLLACDYNMPESIIQEVLVREARRRHLPVLRTSTKEKS